MDARLIAEGAATLALRSDLFSHETHRKLVSSVASIWALVKGKILYSLHRRCEIRIGVRICVGNAVGADLTQGRKVEICVSAPMRLAYANVRMRAGLWVMIAWIAYSEKPLRRIRGTMFCRMWA